MILATSLLLAFWPFECPDCPTTPPFSAVLLYDNQYAYNCGIKVCCMDNGQMQPVYFFMFYGFSPGQKITMPSEDYFQYMQNPVHISSDGTALVLAAVMKGKTVPQMFNIYVKVDHTAFTVSALTGN